VVALEALEKVERAAADGEEELTREARAGTGRERNARHLVVTNQLSRTPEQFL